MEANSTIISRYISEKKVDLSLADSLCALSPADKEAIERLLVETNPSANTLRGWLRIAQEVAHTSATTLADLIADKLIPEITNGFKGSRKEKQKKVQKILSVLRYPELSDLKQRLDRNRKEVISDTGLAVDIPQDLEGDSISIRINVRKQSDFLACGQKIQSLAEHKSIAEIFSILRGDY